MFAVVGIGVRLPGKTNSPQQFFEALSDKKDLLGPIPENRWNGKYFRNDNNLPGGMVNKRCGFIDPYHEFDNEAFEMSLKEALSLDPSVKVMLEVALETFEDSNIKYRGSNTGVFIGSGQQGFAKYSTEVPEYITEYSATGTSLSIHSNMISYKFDLRGPSFTCESACSSSGSAMYTAFNALQQGDVDMALVGGFNNLLNHSMTIAFSRLGVLSKDGICKSFDASANGYVRSEGCGMVLLKPLKNALRDENHVYAVIRSVHANVDGALSPSLTNPSKVAQHQLISRTFEKAGLDPSDVFYVEAHATGTEVGDPIETNTIGKVCKGGECIRLGSVKTNIGHTELASFIVSLVKCCLMIDKRKLLPTIHLEKINPKLKMKKYNMKVQTEVEEFDPHGKIFAVNSFGFGGANACAVFQGHCPEVKTKKDKDSQLFSAPYLYIISARTKNSLKERIEQFQEYSKTERQNYQKNEKFDHKLSYTLNTFAREGDRFLSFGIGPSCHESDFVLPGFPMKEKRPPLCFVFSGQGPQNLGMGRMLFKKYPVFRYFVEKCDEIYKKLTGISVIKEVGLFGDFVGKAEDVNKIMVTLPGLMFTQLGLFELYKSFGIHPDIIIGHSFGEMCAMYANGAVSLEQIIEVTATRGFLCKTLEHLGKMIAVGTSVEEIMKIIKENNIPKLWISAENSPVSCTVGGIPESVAQLDKICEEKKIFHRILSITNAYHTPLLNPLREKAFDSFGKGSLSKLGHPKIPFVSTVTAKFWEKGKDFTPSYFFDNILGTVEFRKGLQKILMDELEYGEKTVFLELAPHPVLSLSMKQCGAKNVLNSIAKGKDEQVSILQSLARLCQFGHVPNWKKVIGGDTRLSYLPTYPFQRKNCFLFVDTLEHERMVPEYFKDPEKKFAAALLGRKTDNTEDIWRNLMNSHKYPWLKDHVVHGATVFPGAGYIEVCLELIKTKYYLKEAQNRKEKEIVCVIRDIEILNPFSVPTEILTFSSFETKVIKRNVFVSSRNQGSIGNWITHMKGSISTLPLDSSRLEDREFPTIENPKVVKKEEIYERFLVTMKLVYGECFRLVEQVLQGDEEVLATLDSTILQSKVDHVDDWYIIHPALLDSIFQCLLLTYKEVKTYLPTEIRSFKMYVNRISPKEYPELSVHAYLISKTEKNLVGNIEVFDPVSKKLLMEVKEFLFNSIQTKDEMSMNLKSSLTVHWQQKRFFGDVFNEKRDLEEFSKKNITDSALKDLTETEFPHLIQWILRKAAPSIDKLKYLTIPSECHSYMDWIKEQQEQKDFLSKEEEKLEFPTSKTVSDFDVEFSLVDNVLKYFPLLLRKKSGNLTEESKRLEWIEQFFTSSLTHKRILEQICELTEFIVKKCERSNRVVRILEISKHPFFSYLESVLPLLSRLEGRLEIILTNSNIPKKKDYSFIHKIEKINLKEKDCFNETLKDSIDIVIMDGFFESSLMQQVRSLLVKEGLLLVFEYNNKVLKFLSDFVFGAIVDHWKPSKPEITSIIEDKKKAQEFIEQNGFHVDFMNHLNGMNFYLSHRLETENKEREEREIIEIFDDEDYCQQEEEEESVFSLLDFVQKRISLKKKEGKAFMPLLILTNGVYDLSNPCIRSSSIIGFTRVLQNEYPTWCIKTVDLPKGENKKDLIELIKNRFWNLENESCFDKDWNEYVPRLIRRNQLTLNDDQEEEEEVEEEEGKSKESSHYRLYIDQKGVLDSLKFHEMEEDHFLCSMGEDDVLVKVYAAPLNFKDVMMSMNMLKNYESDELGIEFSGVIITKGANVNRFDVGDEVFGFADHSLSSHVITSHHLISKKPKNLSHIEASTIPTIFLTTYLGLVKKARIQKGQHVLVHSAAGGVGQAALQWIQLFDAIPIGTCGTKEKRDFLRENYGVKIFGDSHQKNWNEEIEKELGSKVDIVLNSLSKDHIMKGIKMLRPFGSFVEIGKVDILENQTINLLPFLENLSYFSVHIDRMISQRPALVGPLLEEITEYLSQKKIRPVKIDKVFSPTKVSDAFKYMKAGKHMGKIVVNFENKEEEDEDEEADDEEELIIEERKFIFSSSKWYIISGGLGSIGFELTKWMVENGAQKVILLSRSGRMTKHQRRFIEKYAKDEHFKIRVLKTNVVRREEIRKMYGQEIGEKEEVGGIFHLAMVLRDGRIEIQTTKNFHESFDPKIKGAKHLIEEGLSSGRVNKENLDFSIFFSSISAAVGNPEQSNYAAGNYFLDRYAHYLRNSLKLKAASINLGAVVDIGVIAENLKTRKIMEHGVLWGSAMTMKQVIYSIRMIILDLERSARKTRRSSSSSKSLIPSQYIPDFTVDKLIETYPKLTLEFGHLKEHSLNASDALLMTKIVGASTQTLQEIIGEILLIPPKTVPIDEALTRIGVDSISAVEISSILKNKFDVMIHSMEILSGMSIETLLKKIQ